MNAVSDSFNKVRSFAEKLRNYPIIYLCFALGGVPFFFYSKTYKVIIILVLGAIFLYLKHRLDKKYIAVISFLFCIFILQVIIFGAGTFINFGYIFIIVTIPYLSLKIVGNDFLRYFVNILYLFAIISLVFYIVSSLSPSFYEWTSTLPSKYNLDANPVLKKGFIVYSWERSTFQGMLRNPGPFWEPSVYANYLVLGIISQIFLSRKLFNKKNIVFFLAMITTFSTGGYIASFIIILTYLFTTPNLNTAYRLVLIPVSFFVLYVLYNDMDMLGEKINSQLSYQTSVEAEGTSTSGRFLGARKSLIATSRHPLYGRGLIAPTSAESTSDEAGSYGFVSLMMRLGVIGFALWLYNFYRFPVRVAAMNNFSKQMGFGFFIAMLVTNFGQAGFDKPLYLMVFFGGLLGYGFYSRSPQSIIRQRY